MKVLTVAGTRPELIRLSRLVPLLDEQADHVFVHTGQNVGADLRDQFFDELRLRQPDRQLALPNASFAHRVAAVLAAIDDVLVEEQPDRLVILGDTDSGLSAYVAARDAGSRCSTSKPATGPTTTTCPRRSTVGSSTTSAPC